jgi:hypothetical protein
MSRRGLQATLTILGSIAVTFGGLTVLTGAAGVLAGGPASASVDSEMRFYDLPRRALNGFGGASSSS